MTYTILGRCQRTGRLGIGIATFSITVGLYCNGVASNTGVTISQAFANQRNNRLALRLLGQGFTVRSVLAQLLANEFVHPDGGATPPARCPATEGFAVVQALDRIAGPAQ